MNDLITMTETAYLCCCTDKTIRDWQSKRGFPARVNGGRMFSRAEVLAWCEANGVRTVPVQR